MVFFSMYNVYSEGYMYLILVTFKYFCPFWTFVQCLRTIYENCDSCLYLCVLYISKVDLITNFGPT